MGDDWLAANAYAADAERRDRDHRTLPPDATTSTIQRRWLMIGLGVAVLVLVGGCIALDRAGGNAVSEARPLDATQPADDSLVLSWTGTTCDRVDTDRTEVVERDDTVTVKLYVHAAVGGCEDGEAVERAHVVPLEQPLGGRRIEDGACDLEGFRGDPRCGSGGGLGLGDLG